MSGKSNRENKTIYQQRREELNLSREKASEVTHISPGRLEKIEIEKTAAIPEDIKAMADAYEMPELCSYYCANECAIGKKLGMSITEKKGLAKIVLEVLTTLNTLNQDKDRLIEIATDEEVTEDEKNDFERIQEQLDNISATAASLKLWISTSLKEDA